MRGRNPAQDRLEQRIMRASEHENIRCIEAIGKGLTEVDSGDLLCHRVLYPSFFDQRNQQRTGFLASLHTLRLQRSPIGMAADGSLCTDYDYFVLLALTRRSFRTGFNDSDDGNTRCRDNSVQRKRSGRIASDNQELSTLILQVLRRLYRILRNGLDGLRPVGQSSGIAEVEVIVFRQEFK